MPNRKLISRAAAARYLGITERHMRRLIDRRVIAFHDVDGRFMFDVHDLDTFLETIRVEAQS